MEKTYQIKVGRTVSLADIVIPYIKGQALGHTVYRGFVSVKELYPALWVDNYDPHDNPNGYQRPYDEKRSKEAAQYALNKSGAFWYEAVLNVRVRGEDVEPKVGDATLGIDRANIDLGTSGQDENRGILRIKYEVNSKQIGGRTVPWNRAFSVVDSQHRLLSLEYQETSVPVCVFIGLGRLQESVLFKDINDNQKPMPTKLVDQILLRTEGELAQPAIAIARKLHDDSTSPFYGYVDTGGPKVKGQDIFTTLEGLRGYTLLALKEYLEKAADPRVNAADRDAQREAGYEFVKNFWIAVKRTWPEAWRTQDRTYKKYKLLTAVGERALSLLAHEILIKKCIPEEEYSADFIETLLVQAKSFDWDKGSRDMQGISGPGGGTVLFRRLRDIVLPPVLSH